MPDGARGLLAIIFGAIAARPLFDSTGYQVTFVSVLPLLLVAVLTACSGSVEGRLNKVAKMGLIGRIFSDLSKALPCPSGKNSAVPAQTMSAVIVTTRVNHPA